MDATSKTLNGREIVEWERAETPRSTPERPRYYEEVLKVLLDDGSITYVCGWQGCTFTRSAASGVWPHLRVHKTKAPKTSADVAVSPANVADLPVNVVLERAGMAEQFRIERDNALRDLDRVTKQLQEWKPRAQQAEKRLRTIQNAFATAS
ncbi:hypothetical protein [Streptomyces sp. NBC_01601]|uniref:hypothetical protein n=1 Tax=Streptomyces sp. NBC_01601 TaxID=2975892 RepID=UPI002E2A9CA5|nr:hypothetical protein [Streptomyces sp. NBC_01601]